MNCKNCEKPLRTDFSFCSNCGAKVIRNRLTFKNLFYDFAERYFNVDNSFLRTFLHLFSKPQVVIEGYINGIRKKYLNPVSYLGIALTLSGIIVYLMRKNAKKLDYDLFDSGMNTDAMAPLFDFTMDFQAILFILYIPIMAIASWLAFENKGYNFTERQVVFMYTLAHYSLLTIIPSILFLTLAPELYGNFTMYFFGILYLYAAYVIQRITKLKGMNFWARILLFFVIFTIFYFLLSIFMIVFLIVSGQMSLEDFAPK